MKKTAGERLRAFRIDNELKVVELANMLTTSKHPHGVHYNHVVAMQSGRRDPGRELALRIQEVTKDWKHGPILASEW